MKVFDIQLNVSVLAESESEAEREIMLHMKSANVVLSNPNIIEWELLEFLPNVDSGS